MTNLNPSNVKNMRIAIRRDIAEAWTTNNPVLLKGEQGYETDMRRMKIGDGVTEWRLLPYFNGFDNIDGGHPDTIFATSTPYVESGYTPQPVQGESSGGTSPVAPMTTPTPTPTPSSGTSSY